MGIEAVACTRVASRASVFEENTSSSSSSIGRNSDDVSSEISMDENGENEAESAYNGAGPLNAMEALEEALPIRRSISDFYNGKSKSFTSLADAVTTNPSMKDIVKPENAYTRRRRNLMAFNHFWDKNSNRNNPLRSHGGGISKRTMSLSRSALALAVALSNNSDSSSSFTSEDSASSNNSNCYSSHSTLPPLHPRNRVSSSVLSSHLSMQNLSPWRSFSVVDLHNCAIAATMKMSGSSIENETAHHPS